MQQPAPAGGDAVSPSDQFRPALAAYRADELRTPTLQASKSKAVDAATFAPQSRIWKPRS